MRKSVLILATLALLLAPSSLLAQKVELAVTAGGYFPAGAQTDLGTAGVVEGSFAYRIFHVPTVSIYAEVPVARTFDTGIRAIDGNYTATFVTPSLKAKLVPGFFVSPYFVAGVGAAHFSGKSGVSLGSFSNSHTSAAYDVGGGLDVKIFPFVSLRGEIRDFNSGGVGFIVPGVGGRQNNVIATGGLVLRF